MVGKPRKVTIHSAVKQASLKEVKQMLADGADINEVDDQYFTPLLWAANVNAVDILQYLLRNKADPLMVSTQGWTAVHVAAIRGNEICIQALAEYGVSLSTQDHKGFTPGHMACIHGNASCLIALMRSGADKETVDNQGWTMLHAAAYHGRLGCIQVLLRWGLRIEDVDHAGNTAVHLAAMEGHCSALKCLLGRCKTPLYALDMPNNHGETPEDLAKRFMKKDVVGFIFRMKNAQENPSLLMSEFAKHAFPAHMAAYTGNLTELQGLINSGTIKIDERDEQGATALHKAAGQGHVEIVQWLCENGADTSISNHMGDTPADVARRYGELAVLKLLRPDNISDEEYAEIGKKDIRKYERCALPDYSQPPVKMEEDDLLIFKLPEDKERELEECKVQLEYEKLRREKLEARLDLAQREINKLQQKMPPVNTSVYSLDIIPSGAKFRD
ncbi:unnamed protein product [Calicophoron daubneyi]|uniref:Ankyrin repeat domain-containing protein 42 n=1 Tax=Calicophoron daubneyi TaxID=300641 RepID=A0AAV2T9N7_CALDB